MITEGESRLFDEIVYDIDLISLIEDGYLSPLFSQRTETKLDVSKVGTRNGDYIESQLQAAVNIDSITKKCVNEIIVQGTNRKCWLMFCSGIEHALAVRDEIRSRGITCETVTGETPHADRDRIISDYRNGKIRCLTNNAVMVTGVDIPIIDLIGFLRPTKSPIIWVQGLCRGVRLAEGKKDCMVLDFAGNGLYFGPLDKIRPKPRISSGDGDAPKRMCPSCMSLCHAAARECAECGYIFPIDDTPKINAHAVGGALLSNQIDIRTLTVTSAGYYRHVKEGKQDSLKCVYTVKEELKPITSWEFPENPKCLKRWAAWWQKRSKQPIPSTVTQALEWKQTLTPPKFIKVRKNGKYDEIIIHVFE